MSSTLSTVQLTLLIFTILFCETQGEYRFTLFRKNGPYVGFKSNEPGVHDDPVSEMWIEQPLDHFDLNGNVFWKQRYLENIENVQPGGPIFLFLGGDWEINELIIQNGHFYDIAVENNATMYYLEQRFYGQSHPTDNTTVDNLKFLTIEQTLSDTANFLQYIKSNNNSNLFDAKVIVAGASISASYAVWLKQKYPTLVNGVWASSAPLDIRHELPEFKELIGLAIRSVGGDACYNRIDEAFQQMEALVASGKTERIDEEFMTCEHLNKRDQLNVATFFVDLANIMAFTVEFNQPGLDIKGVCAFLTSEAFPDGLSAYAALVRILAGEQCFNFSYDTIVELQTDVNWNSSAAAGGGRQWLFQECNEFGWFPTTGSDTQPFGSSIDLEYFYQICSDVFEGRFSGKEMRSNSKWKNDLFGGLEPRVRNVYFTQGGLDPLRIVGIQLEYNQQSPAVVIPGYSTNRDMNTASELDTLEMALTKKQIRSFIKKWLTE